MDSKLEDIKSLETKYGFLCIKRGLVETIVAVVILIIMVLLTVYFYFHFIANREGMENKEERANEIISATKDMFTSGKYNYGTFKETLGKTDVVEYDAAKRAFKENQFTPDGVSRYM